jgi:hypothetical protein
LTAEQLKDLISASAEQAIAQLDRIADKVSALAGGKPLSLQLNTDQAEERLAALRRSADQLLTDLNGNRTTATALAGAQRNYDAAIEELKTLKSLSRVTYEQELEYLQAISDNMQKYRLSAQDSLDLEQRLLAVQSQIAQRDAQSLDTLLSGITDALAARYETMRDAELNMLSQSREAWQTWRDSSTDAIQAQIDALDALTQAENRAAEEEGYLRRIEKLSQALEYEQDAFNRGQLASQLADAQAEYDAWLAKTSREDEKASLQEQLSAVNARAEAEIDALDRQAAAIKEAYAKQTETAALKAEAEKQLMAGTQQDILSLIATYAPEYNAAGQTLGEQMLEGFAQRAGNIAGWMESLNAMILNVQESLNAALQTAAESFYAEHAAAAGVTITQQNTFNTPVESPAETAFRIRQANEELAAELLET